MSAARYPFWVPVAATLGAWMIRALGRSWRIRRVRLGGEFQDPAIYAFWHARLLTLTYAHRNTNGAVLISRHRDGELIARTIGRLGFVTARGSSTRGGAQGLLELVALAAEGRPIGITPDGPRGPARRAKSGVIQLASLTGLPIVPIGPASARAKVLGSWDGFRIPLPFTRVLVAYGAPLVVPPGLTDEEMETWRARLESAIDAVTREADMTVASRP